MSLADDLEKVATYALGQVENYLSEERAMEAAALLSAAAAAVAALRAPQLAAARDEIDAVRELLRVREGTSTVDKARAVMASNAELRRRLKLEETETP